MAADELRKILHLDLDAFYPSVEVLDDPSLAGKPVIVGGVGGRGVVASASYEARAFGVHSALPTAVARRRCPDGVYLRPRFHRYRELSRAVFDIYRSWTDRVEPLSIDEAYLDVTHRNESGVEVARAIRTQVRERTGLTVSAGVAHNKFLAKLGSDLDKPDGLTVIDPDDTVRFLAPLPVGKLWGVGPATSARLEAAGLATIGDVAAAEPTALRELLGKHGARISRLARGIDERQVQTRGRAKSISAETTFDKDRVSWSEVAPAVRGFAERIAGSLERHELWARTVTLKVRFQDFRTITRSLTPESPVRDEVELRAVARRLARRVDLGRGRRIRLIGLGVSNLVAEGTPALSRARAPQLSLFDPMDDPRAC